ncbi:hypothetical protein C5167_002621 [Papaver somniferum]|uniref:Cupin type-1 domain-containing protein n=1 Tax=Papaver somniferum TaxID=3469 RepID=A0A4Y7L1R3_PAPSO|nr:hypothetical protein C5167_002621 [Papaver somniferum]
MAATLVMYVMICLVFGFLSSPIAQAGDPDIVTDFVIPANATLDGSSFTFTGIRNLYATDPPPTFRVTKIGMKEFPALNGQSVSMAILDYPAGSVNPPHTHPRSAELLFVVEGSLDVGFIDTTNMLFTQTLQPGDMFIFPKGLVHFQYNKNATEPAAAVSAFGSANAGTVSVPMSVFATGIDDAILAESFKTDAATIQKIKAVFGFLSSPIAQAGDPDIITDFVIPEYATLVGSSFTFTGIRNLYASDPPPTFRVTKIGMKEFPALNGQSVSMAILDYPAGSVNPPHTHPRSAELLFVVDGSLDVGFIDTTNMLFTQTLQSGDMFIFPKGLVHFQYNKNATESATAVSAFGSANAGTVSVPMSVFATGIDDEILAESFKTDVATIQKIKAAQAGDPDIITDFIIPANATLDGSSFTYTGIRNLYGTHPPPTFRLTKAGMKEFPALNGQSVSMAILDYPAGSVNPPHTHPHSAELLFVVQGCPDVGFIDTTNVLFTQTLEAGDMFIFPKGLVHFQYNNDTESAAAVSMFGSANARTVSVPTSVFTTDIDDEILAKSFKTDVATIQKIKAGLAPNPK